jgi:hypothetical protein
MVGCSEVIDISFMFQIRIANLPSAQIGRDPLPWRPFHLSLWRSARRFTKFATFIFLTESKLSSTFWVPMVRFRPLVVYLPIENRIAPMAYPGTNPRSPRGSVMANVKTMGGRRSRYWCGPGSVRANQNGARLSESGIGALQIEKNSRPVRGPDAARPVNSLKRKTHPCDGQALSRKCTATRRT